MYGSILFVDYFSFIVSGDYKYLDFTPLFYLRTSILTVLDKLFIFVRACLTLVNYHLQNKYMSLGGLHSLPIGFELDALTISVLLFIKIRI